MPSSMPFEIFALALTAIVAATIIIRTMIKAGNRSESPALSRSELQHLLREAVEEGNLPLQKRIQELEHRVDRPLAPARSAPQLEGREEAERSL